MKELEDEELMRDGNFLHMPEDLRTSCVMVPCTCLLMYLEMKVNQLEEVTRKKKEQ